MCVWCGAINESRYFLLNEKNCNTRLLAPLKHTIGGGGGRLLQTPFQNIDKTFMYITPYCLPGFQWSKRSSKGKRARRLFRNPHTSFRRITSIYAYYTQPKEKKRKRKAYRHACLHAEREASPILRQLFDSWLFPKRKVLPLKREKWREGGGGFDYYKRGEPDGACKLIRTTHLILDPHGGSEKPHLCIEDLRKVMQL